MKNLKMRILRLTFLFVSLFSWTLAYGQITPSSDAYTNTATPTTNYGSKPLLDVESASQTSFIQFDLSSIPAGYTSANLAKASLKLYVNAVTTAGSFNVDLINGAWSEKTITADLSPALGSTIASSVLLTTANVHDYILIDVTSAVGAWLDGTQANDGIALVANSPLNASFDSKENTANSQPPELDIVLTGNGTGTITGVTTANGSGLTGGGKSGTLNLSLMKTCTTNQVLQWTGKAWACSSAGSGTITAVTPGTDLTGGGMTGNVTLNLDTTKVPQLNGGNSFSGNQGVNGNVSATQLISTAAQGTAPLQVTSTTQVSNLNASLLDGLSASAFQQIGSYATLGANTFSATQTVGSGDVSVNSGNLDLPQTAGAAGGAIDLGGLYFIHACCSVNQANTFVGQSAGNFTTTGSNNTAAGNAALLRNTTGNNNTASGFEALYSNTSGGANTASGQGALANNTTGNNNTASGEGALISNTTGSANTASGSEGLYSNTTGTANTASGLAALYNNKTGSFNTALGYNAGPDVNSPNLTNATAIGANAVVSESNAVVLGGSGVKVGIGTTKPGFTLDVQGTGNFTGVVNFGSGQTFPGTVSSVTAGTNLTNTGTSTNPILNVAGNITTSGVITGAGVVSTANLSASGSVSGSSAAFNGSTTGNTVFAGNNGTGPGLTAQTNGSFALQGVAFFDSDFSSAVVGNQLGTTTKTVGVVGDVGSPGAGVRGLNGPQSNIGTNLAPVTGVWGDTGKSGYRAVLATADDGNGVWAQNNSSSGYVTLYAENDETTSASNLVFETFGKGFNGACSIDVSGNLNCSHSIAVGTSTPHSAIEANANLSGGLGTAVTVTNSGVGLGTAASLDFNTYPPQSSGTYNPMARIIVKDDGNYSVQGFSFQVNNPGAANNGLVEVLNVSRDFGSVFQGDLNVGGTLTKHSGSFKIDHPLEPADKYLYHSFVESPDMMNVYNGNITTNDRGLATVVLPDYFEALNRNFRYQLTVIGQFAQAIVAREVSHNRFTIKTNRPRVQVSWQVTGIRHDAWANAHRIQVEVEKPPQERGRYLSPELFGASQQQAIGAGLSTPSTGSALPTTVSLVNPLCKERNPTK